MDSEAVGELRTLPWYTSSLFGPLCAAGWQRELPSANECLQQFLKGRLRPYFAAMVLKYLIN